MTREEFIAKNTAWLGDDGSYKRRFGDLAAEVYDLKNDNPVLADDDVVLTEADSGKTYNIATDAKTFTLPLIATTNLGMKLKFRNTGADGAIALTLSPNALDAVHGSIANATADAVAGGVVNKDIVLTKTTANKGDWIELTAVAATEWYISGGVGIWASEG